MTHVTDVHNDKILSNDNEDYESVNVRLQMYTFTSVLVIVMELYISSELSAWQWLQSDWALVTWLAETEGR